MTSSGTASPPPAERLPGRPAPTVKEALPRLPAPVVVDAAQPAVPILSNETPVAGNDAMGARLIVGPRRQTQGRRDSRLRHARRRRPRRGDDDSRVIRIAENGSFSGKVSIDIAEIHGTFEGELTARSQLIIRLDRARQRHHHYGKLVADEGGELCGDINVIAANSGSSAHAINSASTPKPAGLVLGVVSA